MKTYCLIVLSIPSWLRQLLWRLIHSQGYHSSMPAKSRPSSSAPRTPAKTPQRSLGSASADAAVPPVPNGPGRYVLAWLTDGQPHDPVFASADSIAAAERASGLLIQPYEHCPHQYYPTVAAKCGLERFVPTSQPPIGNRGPNCRLPGQKSFGNCHKPCLPTFMFL